MMRTIVHIGLGLALGLGLVGDAHAADFVPSGAEHLDKLLGPDAFEDVSRPEVARTVEKQGFWAGDPIGVSQCASCHADVAAQWSSSAHRFASFNNPYYSAAVEAFRKERGNPASRFCAGCHDPALVLSNRIDAEIDHRTREAQAGIVCLTCHSIAEHPPRTGNGAFTAKLAAWPTSGAGHAARLRPAAMATSDFCATCHRVGLTEDVTHARWLRGQDDFGPWLGSSLGGAGAAAIHRAPTSQRCQDCHMPLVEAPLGDAAAKPGGDGVPRIRSHFVVGANSALPHLRGDDAQEARVAALSRARVSLSLVQQSPSLLDVVLRTHDIGHRFPGGTMDSNEVWLAVVALDRNGKELGRSGALDASGELGREAHVVRAQQVDEHGVPLALRDVQHARGVVFDASLTPGDPQAVRYALPRGTARVVATLRYRKLSPTYVRFACADIADASVRARCTPPIVELATVTRTINAEPAACETLAWDVALDHGIALAGALADRADEARAWLACAEQREPTRIEPLLGQARLALTLGRTDDVVALTQRATLLDRNHPASDYLAAVALLKAYRARPAHLAAEQLAKKLPNDPAALALLARARGLDGDARGALRAATALLAIDPDSEDGHLQRSLALRDLHRDDEARREEALYLRYRTATEDNLELRRRYREWSAQPHDESEPLHVHELQPQTMRVTSTAVP